MTDKDKLAKLIAEIKRLYNQGLADENRQAGRGLELAANVSYGKSIVCKELLSFIDSMQKEPKKCMFSKDNYTDEDRKVLCDSCEEKCELNKKEEPLSEDFETEWKCYCDAKGGGAITVNVKELARHFAAWQKQQMMKDSVLCGVDGWFINNKRNCRKNGRFHKYYVSTITHDKPLPMENGKDYRLITIKED